jgi:hypothetical protein
VLNETGVISVPRLQFRNLSACPFPCACAGFLASAVSFYKGGHTMKTSLILFTILAVLVLTSAPAAANPTMLPKHPGYPMDKATDPVKGQPLANDAGQQNATGDKALMEAAAFEDTHVMQSLSASPNEQEIRNNVGPTASPKKEQTENKDVGKRK